MPTGIPKNGLRANYVIAPDSLRLAITKDLEHSSFRAIAKGTGVAASTIAAIQRGARPISLSTILLVETYYKLPPSPHTEIFRSLDRGDVL